MVAHQSPVKSRPSKLENMEESSIVRQGILYLSGEAAGNFPWLYEDYFTSVEDAIAKKALEMGYHAEDTVHYKIIIDPKV